MCSTRVRVQSTFFTFFLWLTSCRAEITALSLEVSRNARCICLIAEWSHTIMVRFVIIIYLYNRIWIKCLEVLKQLNMKIGVLGSTSASGAVGKPTAISLLNTMVLNRKLLGSQISLRVRLWKARISGMSYNYEKILFCLVVHALHSAILVAETGDNDVDGRLSTTRAKIVNSNSNTN